MKRIIFAVIIFAVTLWNVYEAMADSISTTLYSVADSDVDSYFPENNSGSSGTISARAYNPTNPISTQIERAYLRFDLSSIPDTAVITSAVLTLYSCTRNSNADITVHRVDDDIWLENAITWNNQPGFDAAILAQAYVGGSLGFIDWDITSSWSAREDICDNALSLALKVIDENLHLKQATWASKEFFGGQKPALTIEYDDNPTVPPPDADCDKIANEIDGYMHGPNFVDQSSVASDYFTDEHLSAGSSFGHIINRGGLAVSVEEEPNPSGMLISASGSGTATVDACGFELSLTDGDSVVASCSSLAAEVLAGPVEIQLDTDIVVIVPTDGEATVTEPNEGQFEVENTGNVTITVYDHGVPEELEPGELGTYFSTSTCLWDIEPESGDGDVDGSDLAEYGNGTIVDLEVFVNEFGKTDCSN